MERSARSVSRRQIVGLGGAGAAAVLLGTGVWNASGSYAAPPNERQPLHARRRFG
jgi:alkaline phosphatase D